MSQHSASSATTADPPVPRRPPATLLVSVLGFAGIVVALQQTMVIPIVGQLPRLLDASADDATWVVTSTLLAGAVATPVAGRLADMVGKRRILLISLALLVAGSLISAMSTALVPMVIGRVLQGLASGVIPLGISLMRDHLPAERLGSATAAMSASLGVGGALGLPLGALIAQYADWHALFWAGGAAAALATVLVVTLVPESPQRAGGRFDALGALGLSVALIALLLAVSKGSSWGWASTTTLGLLAAAVVVLLAWGVWELRTPQPLVDLRVSARRQVLLTNIASVAFGFAMFSMSLVFPQLLQLPAATGYGLGRSVLVAGLVLVPAGLATIAMSPISARITTRSGPRSTLMLGAAVVAVGYGLGVVAHSEIWHLIVSSVAISCGVGLAYGAMPTLVMSAVPSTQIAAGNSLNQLMRSLGLSFASAVGGVLLAQLTTTVGGATVPSESAFVVVMLVGAAGALLALAIAAFIPRHRPRTTPPTDPGPVGEHVEDDRIRPTSTGPLLASGVVRQLTRPAVDAVVTVVDSAGRYLGHHRTDPDGRYTVRRHAPGVPHLVVVQWEGASRAEFLHGNGPHRRDIDLERAIARPTPPAVDTDHRIVAPTSS